MDITGRIKTILPLQQGVSARGPWSKATVVIEYQKGNYTNTLALDNMSKAEEFAKLPVGAEFKFLFDVTSREHQGRYYTSCNCFGWQTVEHLPTAPQGASPVGTGAEDGDMPF